MNNLKEKIMRKVVTAEELEVKVLELRRKLTEVDSKEAEKFQIEILRTEKDFYDCFCPLCPGYLTDYDTIFCYENCPDLT